MNARKRDLVGRKIVGVVWNQFATGRGRGKTTNPYLFLDNGVRVFFNVDECESEYGVRIGVTHKISRPLSAPPDQRVTVPSLAMLTGLTPYVIREMCKRGDFDTIKTGGNQWRVLLSSANHLLAQPHTRNQ